MERCDRPGCGGELDATGYCRRCLMPPLGLTEPVVAERVVTEPVPERMPESSVHDTLAAPPPAPRPPAQVTGGGPWWGLELVSLPRIAGPSPDEAVLTDPRVPEDDRRCAACGRPVGVSHDGQPGLAEGRCQWDGTPYSFVPRLRAGEVLADRYRVAGCIGHGGVGWVYLAYDGNLNNRPVALKGLIDADDPGAARTAADEKRFLIELKHDDIVDIYDCVTHQSPDRGGYQSYLVMEYVPGYPLTSPRLLSIELEPVLGYVLRVLRVFQYLHDGGYLFCDLKPCNLMVYGSDVKLIDLGGIAGLGERGTGAYTPGYEAPELGTTGPTVATDIFTVGRTLQSLFRWHVADTEAAVYAPLRHLIARATRTDPTRRFASASDMAAQLSGVLRELVARREGRPRPARSPSFAGATALIGSGLGAVPPLAWWTTNAARRAAVEGTSRRLSARPPAPVEAAAGLPEPFVDPADPAAAFLSTSLSADPRVAVGQLAAYQGSSVEAELLRCRLHLRLGEVDEAHAALDQAARLRPTGWRVDWHQGLLALAEERYRDAGRMFASCYQDVPGELAPRLASALCAEYQASTDAELDAVAAAYLRVWRTDSWYESAAFGCARALMRRGDRAGAVGVLGEVPRTSSHHRAARIAALRVHTSRLGDGPEAPPDAADLAEAERHLADLGRDRGSDGDAEQLRRLTIALFEAALDRVRASGPDGLPTGGELAAVGTERGIRLRLEAEHRVSARRAARTGAGTILVDLANAVRPATLR